MNRFIIQHHCITLASIARRTEQQTLPLPVWRFEFSDKQILQILGDTVEPVGDINLHTGLTIITETVAESRDEAEANTKNLVEHLLNVVTFSELTFCHPAQLISVIEFRKERTTSLKSVIYPFDKSELMGSLSPINEVLFRGVFDAFNKCAQQQRVARALSWLRKGINEENFVDEFTAYWIGLEVIKSVLRRMLQMRTRDPGEWDGVKEIYETELAFTNFDKVEEARSRLLHGFTELSDTFISEIKSYVEPTRKTLISSIATVLDLPQTSRDTLQARTVRRLRRKPWIVLEGELGNLPDDFDDLAKNLPNVKADLVSPSFSIGEDGNLSMKTQVTQRFVGPAGVVWTPRSSEYWGDEDAGIIKADLNI